MEAGFECLEADQNQGILAKAARNLPRDWYESAKSRGCRWLAPGVSTHLEPGIPVNVVLFVGVLQDAVEEVFRLALHRSRERGQHDPGDVSDLDA